MLTHDLSISDALRDRISSAGPVGVRWLQDLPGLVEACAHDWGIEPGYVVERPTDAVVVRARRGDTPLVLKFWPPGATAYAREVAVLSAARGRGYVELFDADAERSALLLEALGNTLDPVAVEAERGPDAIREVYVATLRQAWTAPIDALPTGEVHPAQRLIDEIGRAACCDEVPGGDRAVARALAYAEQRLAADDPGRHVLAHGLVIPMNVRSTLAPRPGAESGYALVEPLGLRVEREYDLGSVLLEANKVLLGADDPVLLVRGWCAYLAGETETDAESVWQWAFVQRVARGLTLMSGPTPLTGRVYLQAAAALVARRRA